MSNQTPFWSRTYSVRNRTVVLNLYFGETKLSELTALIDQAKAELVELGLDLPTDSAVLTSNRAGLHLSAWIFFRTDEVGLAALLQKLEAAKWKQASD